MNLTVEAIRAAGQRAMIYPAHVPQDLWTSPSGLGWPTVAAAEVLGLQEDDWPVLIHALAALLSRGIGQVSEEEEDYWELLWRSPTVLGKELLDKADEMEAKECNSQ